MNVLILGGGKAISNFTNYKIIGSNATPPKTSGKCVDPHLKSATHTSADKQIVFSCYL